MLVMTWLLPVWLHCCVCCCQPSFQCFCEPALLRCLAFSECHFDCSQLSQALQGCLPQAGQMHQALKTGSAERWSTAVSTCITAQS
jgi:hypothetical protein